jgi:hypothetical protein
MSRRASSTFTPAVALIEGGDESGLGKAFDGRPQGSGAIVLREKRAKPRPLTAV